jgi:hypothetical protein
MKHISFPRANLDSKYIFASPLRLPFAGIPQPGKYAEIELRKGIQVSPQPSQRCRIFPNLLSNGAQLKFAALPGGKAASEPIKLSARFIESS